MIRRRCDCFFLLLLTAATRPSASIFSPRTKTTTIATNNISSSTTSANDEETNVRIQTILEDAGFAPTDIDTVLDGQLHKRILDSTNEREIGMAFAVLVPNTTPDDLVEVFISQRLKKTVDPDVTGVGLIGAGNQEASLEDFKDLSLFRDGPKKSKKHTLTSFADELVQASPSDDLNLSREEISDFRKIATDDQMQREAQVDQSLRQMLYNRYQSYRESGLNGLLPYARSNGDDYNPGEDMKLSSKMTHILQREAPIFFNYLTDFPSSKKQQPQDDDPHLKESFSWVSFEPADGKPNVQLIHRMGRKQPDKGSYVFAERQYFTLNAFNCVHGEGGAFEVDSDDAKRTLLIFASRTSTDAVTGFGGSAKRAVGVRMMGNMVSDILEKFTSMQQ